MFLFLKHALIGFSPWICQWTNLSKLTYRNHHQWFYTSWHSWQDSIM